MNEEKKSLKIEVDIELVKILDKLESKIKKATWDGMDKISKRTLTRVLARKINSSNLI